MNPELQKQFEEGEPKSSKTATTTYMGIEFDILNPDSWVFNIKDIAMSLTNIARYNGHTEGHYSVAEHSIYVALYLRDRDFPPEVVLCGLLHDGVEAYLLDMPSPWKSHVRIGLWSYRDLETAMENAFFQREGLYDVWTANKSVIKEADLAVYLQERALRPSPAAGMNHKYWYTRFLAIYNELKNQIQPTNK